MQLTDWLAHQEAQHPKAIELGLERVRAVALKLGLLPWSIPAVIVGGTNGKGSTVAFLTALAREAGLKVGTYTSPHLQRYNERVEINGEPVADALLISAFERIEVARGAISLTFFEYGTLAAFIVFAEQAIDAAVIEVGLGGRLDATNIIDADVAVLCSVGLDHQDWLGPTIEDIGREKSGIFRAGRPVILGSANMPNSVTEATRRLGAIVHTLDQHFEVVAGDSGSWCWQSAERSHGPLPSPSLLGPMQQRNAAVAIAALLQWLRVRPELASRLPTHDVQTSLIAAALQSARLRGRVQRVAPREPTDPEWILDVAHNEDSSRVLAEALGSLPPARRTFGVVGILADKDADMIGRHLAPVIDTWVLCALDGSRGCSAEDLRRRLPKQCRSVALAPDVPHGCATARALAGEGDRIVVFGSFHVVGPALDWLGL
ncbi:MAG: bifunctional folylpolyglutamate synthase/dihydrofolate synthase [Gammaproteobacteria bacterium]